MSPRVLARLTDQAAAAILLQHGVQAHSEGARGEREETLAVRWDLTLP